MHVRVCVHVYVLVHMGMLEDAKEEKPNTVKREQLLEAGLRTEFTAQMDMLLCKEKALSFPEVRESQAGTFAGSPWTAKEAISDGWCPQWRREENEELGGAGSGGR